MPKPQFDVKFVPSGRGKARCEPNPEYPDGIHINLAMKGMPSCSFDLPYPAPECGHWESKCKECGYTCVVTAAGRPDDPRSATFPCAKQARNN